MGLFSGLGVELYAIYALQARASMPSTRSRIRGGRTSSINYWTQPRVGFTGSAMGKHTTKRQGREIVRDFVASRGSTCGSEIVNAARGVASRCSGHSCRYSTSCGTWAIVPDFYLSPI